MSIVHRPVPRLPFCPRARAIAEGVRRSYPTGRRKFSRAICGEVFELTISTTAKFPPDVRATLVTTVNVNQAAGWMEFPFERADDKTLVCKLTPDRPGLYSFWARFSLDGGTTWQHDPVPDSWVLVDPPHIDQIRMYTMIPGVSGTIDQWSAQLEHIKEMGFNAVHLLPLTTLDTSKSPYSARDLFDVDPSHLANDPARSGLEQLEQFIARAQQLNVRLCFDLVMNHVGTQSQIATNAPEWIIPDEDQPDGLRRARFFSDKGWENWNDIVLINYEHPSQHIRADIHGYMTQYALFWAGLASQTNGLVRFDNLHSSDKGFIDSLTTLLRREYPNIAVVAEYFTDTNTLLETVPKWGLNLVLATPWDRRFVPQLRDYLRYIHSISEQVRFFMPVTSHDSGSPAQEFGSVESTIPRYVAAALLGTGSTGITQGVEWGIAKKIEFIGELEKLTPPAELIYAPFIRKINDILIAEPAFRRGDNCVFVDDNHHAVIAAFRKDPRHAKLGFVVACNFDIFNPHVLEVDLSPLLDGSSTLTGIDLITQQQMAIQDNRAKLTLPPCAAVVLRLSTAAEP